LPCLEEAAGMANAGVAVGSGAVPFLALWLLLLLSLLSRLVLLGPGLLCGDCWLAGDAAELLRIDERGLGKLTPSWQGEEGSAKFGRIWDGS